MLSSMGIKFHFVSISLGASVDQQTGNMSVFDVLEEVRAPQLPVHLQSLVISMILDKKDQTEFQGKMMIHLILPDGSQQMVGAGDMQIPSEQKRMKAVFRFGGFPIPQFGAYRFVLSCLTSAGSKVAEALLDFEAIQVSQPQPGATNSTDRTKLAH